MPVKWTSFRAVSMPDNVASDSDLDGTFEWDTLLKESCGPFSFDIGDSDARCSDIAVPVEVFYQAPFHEYMKHVTSGLMVEVSLDGDYSKFIGKNMELFWIAHVIKIAGYRLLLRYEGMDNVGDEVQDFWVNIGSTDIRPVGYCAENLSTRGLIPPECIRYRHDDWSQYLMCRIHAFRTLSSNWPDIQVRKLTSSKLKKGVRVELLDSMVSMRLRPARVEDTVGSRLLVKVYKKDANKTDLRKLEDIDDEDNQVEDGVWMDQDSPLLFPVGWASTMGYKLSASEEYCKRTREIAAAIKSDSAILPYGKNDARPSMFKVFLKNPTASGKNKATWEKGMKLEILDPLDTWKELRVATVLDVLQDGYLKIGFDGEEMEEDPIPIHCSSVLLFPVGYCKKYGLKLKGPKETDNFNWNEYLKKTKSIAAPEELFEPMPTKKFMEGFKIGAKIEAVDMCEPHLICAATVAAHRGRLLQIKYDGWDDSFDQLFDYRSNDIFPIGWCEMHGYRLEAPKI